MRLSKRARITSDDEDESTTNGITYDRDGSKRQRIEDQQSDGLGGSSTTEGDEDEDDDDDDDDDDVPLQVELPTQAADDEMEDDGLEHPGGSIKSIHLVNFMCHSKMDIEFGSRINFICGQNGAGKSAILTGIIICLGSKATATNRAPKLNDLIKSGTQSGHVTIVLANKGINFYKREIYGDEIRVTRRFKRDGANSYKIQGSLSNKIISTKREELDEILSALNIVLDNPMTILSQDRARTFLSNATDNDLYRMFIEGTGLQQILDDLDNVEANVNKAETVAHSRRKRLELEEQRMKDAEMIYQQSLDQRDLAKQLAFTASKAAWAAVRDGRLKVKLSEQEVDQLQKDLKGLIQNENKIEQLEEEARRALEEKRNEKDDHLKRKEQFRNEIAQISDNIRQNSRTMTSFRSDERSIVSDLQGVKESIKSIRANIVKQQESLKRAGVVDQDELANEYIRLQDEIKELANQKDSLTQDIISIESKIDELNKTELAALKQKRANHEKNIASLTREKTELEASRKNRLAGFDRGVISVLRRIKDEERRWKEKPIGPLGQFISLEEPKWGPIIETFLGSNLDGFLVTNHEDRALLARLMSAERVSIPVIMRKDAKLDFEAKSADKRFLSILGALNFSNDYVKYSIIDLHQIEQAILIENRAEADRVMFEQRPHNVRQCYALHPETNLKGFRVGGRGGASSTVPVNGRRLPRMQTSVEDQIVAVKRDILKDQNHLELVKESYRETMTIVQRLQRERQSKDQELRNLRQELSSRKIELENPKYSTNVEEEKRAALIELESQLEQEIESEGKLENQYEDLIRAKDNCANEATNLHRIKEEINSKLGKFEDQIQEFEEEVRKCEIEKDNIYAQRKNMGKETTRLTREIEEATKVLKNREEKVKIYLERAMASHAEPIEIPENQTTEAIMNEAKRLQAKFKARERESGRSFEDILRVRDETRINYQTDLEKINKLEYMVQRLKDALLARRRSYIKQRSNICAGADREFRASLSRRGFSGRLVFHHRDKRLDLIFSLKQIEDEDDEESMRSIRSFSGGEKSFVQVCLLRAIWQSVRTPLRGVDEFDVYMDSVNRKIGMITLVEAARSGKYAQTLFITPLNIDNMNLGKDVTILEIVKNGSRRREQQQEEEQEEQ